MNDNAERITVKSSIYSYLKTNYLNLLLPVFLVYYLIVAYNSVGYHHYDEHYQIIEFANYKLGLTSKNGLAWEFNSQIRSGLQPLICFVLLKLFDCLGVTDVYTLAFLLRAVTAVFSIWVIRQFVVIYKHYIINPLQNYFIAFSFLLWFLPYINVRFSSETWSGLFLLLTLIVVEKSKDHSKLKDFAIIGLLLGFAMLFRYQSALFIVGIYLWLLLVRGNNIRQMTISILALLLVLLIGVLIDFWLYGKFTFSIYNYFHVNLVQGVSNQFGTSPFYQYIIYILNAPGPIGLLILTSFFVLWYYDPKNLLLWAITPFLIIHSFIPHKELRFLFPLANLCPIVFFLALQKLYQGTLSHSFKQYYQKYLGIGIIAIIVVLNILGLYAISSMGAGRGKTSVTAFIHRNFDGKKTNIILNGNNAYITSQGQIKGELAQHQEMAKTYLDGQVSSLKAMYPNLSDHDAKCLVVSGYGDLQSRDSDTYKAMLSNYSLDNSDVVTTVGNFKNGTSGTNCN